LISWQNQPHPTTSAVCYFSGSIDFNQLARTRQL
jgi:hypothetical protein